jgi:hypothetical protein
VNGSRLTIRRDDTAPILDAVHKGLTSTYPAFRQRDIDMIIPDFFQKCKLMPIVTVTRWL